MQTWQFPSTSDGAGLVGSHWLLHLLSPQKVVPSAGQGSWVQFKGWKQGVLLLYECIRAVHGSQRDHSWGVETPVTPGSNSKGSVRHHHIHQVEPMKVSKDGPITFVSFRVNSLESNCFKTHLIHFCPISQMFPLSSVLPWLALQTIWYWPVWCVQSLCSLMFPHQRAVENDVSRQTVLKSGWWTRLALCPATRD